MCRLDRLFFNRFSWIVLLFLLFALFHGIFSSISLTLSSISRKLRSNIQLNTFARAEYWFLAVSVYVFGNCLRLCIAQVHKWQCKFIVQGNQQPLKIKSMWSASTRRDSPVRLINQSCMYRVSDVKVANWLDELADRIELMLIFFFNRINAYQSTFLQWNYTFRSQLIASKLEPLDSFHLSLVLAGALGWLILLLQLFIS